MSEIEVRLLQSRLTDLVKKTDQQQNKIEILFEIIDNLCYLTVGQFGGIADDQGQLQDWQVSMREACEVFPLEQETRNLEAVRYFVASYLQKVESFVQTQSETSSNPSS